VSRDNRTYQCQSYNLIPNINPKIMSWNKLCMCSESKGELMFDSLRSRRSRSIDQRGPSCILRHVPTCSVYFAFIAVVRQHARATGRCRCNNGRLFWAFARLMYSPFPSSLWQNGGRAGARQGGKCGSGHLIIAIDCAHFFPALCVASTCRSDQFSDQFLAAAISDAD